jgi:hypothetical protein
LRRETQTKNLKGGFLVSLEIFIGPSQLHPS